MVKLVDTLVSGTSERKLVQVRVLFWALRRVSNSSPFFYLLSVSYDYYHPLLLQKWEHFRVNIHIKYISY